MRDPARRCPQRPDRRLGDDDCQQQYSRPPACRGGTNIGGVADEYLGRTRGGFGNRLHLTTEPGGNPIAATCTTGQRHESTHAVDLLEEMLSRMWPDAVAGDKAYSTIDICNWLTRHEVAAVIPYKDNESGAKDYDRDAYRERSIIERTINRLKR